MTAPVLPALALAPLRTKDVASLTARGYRGTLTKVRQPGGVYVDTWVYATVSIPSRLNPLALDSPLRSDQPSAARRWQLATPTGTQVKAGERWRIEGETNGETWSRTVAIDEPLFPRSNELVRRALCTDVASNP